MGVEMSALIAATIFLAGVILGGRQWALMVAVALYAAVVSWLIQRDLSMVMPALGVAIALGILGLSRVVLRELSPLGDTCCDNPSRTVASNETITDNLGS